MRGLGAPVLATAVGYSHVHAGVPHPGDVIVGALTGRLISRLVVELSPTD